MKNTEKNNHDDNLQSNFIRIFFSLSKETLDLRFLKA